MEFTQSTNSPTFYATIFWDLLAQTFQWFFSVKSSDSLIGCKAISARSLSLLSIIVQLLFWSILFRKLKLFSPCINSEFRTILSLCHCQALLSKRSFLLILYFWNSQGGQEDYCPPPRYTTVPDLRKGNPSRCNIKRASPMDAPPLPLRVGHA